MVSEKHQTPARGLGLSLSAWVCHFGRECDAREFRVRRSKRNKDIQIPEITPTPSQACMLLLPTPTMCDNDRMHLLMAQSYKVEVTFGFSTATQSSRRASVLIQSNVEPHYSLHA